MPDQPEALWTVAEFSAHSKLAKSTIYEWVRKGFIPHLRMGGVIRFRPGEVREWLDRHGQAGRPGRLPNYEPST
jgi:excisionase family DNA binding protein